MKLTIVILANLAMRILPALLVLLAGSILGASLDRSGSTTLGAFVIGAHAICAFSTIYIALMSVHEASK